MGLIGRERDLARVEAALASANLVTVLGPPGVGKTRLAARVLDRARDRFPGGAVFCDLADARSADDLAARVAEALGVDSDEVGRALALRDATLVLLDNVEQLVPYAAALAGWLDEAPSARFLLTSREPVGLSGEVRLELEPLDAGDGALLLLARAESLRPGWAHPDRDRVVLEGIVRRLDGLPLAIELAAGRAPLMTPRDLFDRLSSRFAVLVAPGASGRQSTLRAALDWSWELLTPPQREVLAASAVFVGDFGLDDAEAVIGSPALDELQALRERSLLADAGGEETRLRMLESVQAYAGEKLEASGARDEVCRRHAQYSLRTGERLAKAADLDRLAREAGNLRAAHRWLIRREPADAVRVALVLDQLFRVRGPFAPHMAMLDEAIRLAPDRALRARCLCARGDARLVRRRATDAEADFATALALAGEIGDRALEVDALRGLAIALRDLGRHGEASKRFNAALERCDDPHLEARLHSSAGTLLRFQGQPAAALERYQRSLALFLEIGQARGEAIVRGNLGHVYAATGRPDDADREYRAALATVREIGDRRSEAILTGALAGLLVERGYPTDAAPLYQRALALFRELGDEPMTALHHDYLAALAALEGRIAEAEQGFARGKIILERARGGGWVEAHAVLEGILDLARARQGDPARHLGSARGRLDRAAAPTPGPSAEHVVFAAGWLARLLAGVHAPAAPPAAPGPALQVGPEARWFQMAGGPRVELGRRKPLRGVLRVLVDQRRQTPGQPVSATAIAGAVWPEARLDAKAAASRVYVVVAELRKLGLVDAVARQEGGYLLHPAIALVEPAGSQ